MDLITFQHAVLKGGVFEPYLVVDANQIPESFLWFTDPKHDQGPFLFNFEFIYHTMLLSGNY